MGTGQYPRKRATVSEFFQRYARADSNGCLLWTGSLDGYGYARVYDAANKRHLKVTRWVLSKKLGRPLRARALACHTCDVRACVNEDHLYEGTHKTNADDKYARGVGNRGVHQGQAKLDDAMVRAIRADTTKTYRALGMIYGVSLPTIQAVKAGRTWRHVK